MFGLLSGLGRGVAKRLSGSSLSSVTDALLTTSRPSVNIGNLPYVSAISPLLNRSYHVFTTARPVVFRIGANSADDHQEIPEYKQKLVELRKLDDQSFATQAIREILSLRPKAVEKAIEDLFYKQSADRVFYELLSIFKHYNSDTKIKKIPKGLQQDYKNFMNNLLLDFAESGVINQGFSAIVDQLTLAQDHKKQDVTCQIPRQKTTTDTDSLSKSKTRVYSDFITASNFFIKALEASLPDDQKHRTLFNDTIVPLFNIIEMTLSRKIECCSSEYALNHYSAIACKMIGGMVDRVMHDFNGDWREMALFVEKQRNMSLGHKAHRAEIFICDGFANYDIGDMGKLFTDMLKNSHLYEEKLAKTKHVPKHAERVLSQRDDQQTLQL